MSARVGSGEERKGRRERTEDERLQGHGWRSGCRVPAMTLCRAKSTRIRAHPKAILTPTREVRYGVGRARGAGGGGSRAEDQTVVVVPSNLVRANPANSSL